jgi:hypothetical protein
MAVGTPEMEAAPREEEVVVASLATFKLQNWREDGDEAGIVVIPVWNSGLLGVSGQTEPTHHVGCAWLSILFCYGI